MPPPRWFLKSINYEITADGVIITITTDVGCHLACRLTTLNPRIHLDPLFKRGVALRAMPRYCFAAYLENWQEEPGNTLTHTFIKEPWPVCETRWFYFYGYVAAVYSPSESPLLSFHRTAPPQTVTFYPHAGIGTPGIDGQVARTGVNETWPVIIAGAGTLAEPVRDRIYIEFTISEAPNFWQILYRGHLGFDCLALPPGATIISAKVRLHCLAKHMYGTLYPTYGICQGYPLSNDDLVPADYSRFHDIPLCDTPIPFADISVGRWNEWDLNAAGLALIQTGIVQLGTRVHNYDMLAGIPPGGDWWVATLNWATMEYNPIVAPQLVVTFQA
ncbi:hypothetical protein ES708_15510 [subsurface metagenome]